MVGVERAVLWTHIAAGVVALVLGGVALATEKGGRTHRRAGRGYVASMGVVVATVLPLFALEQTFFRTFLLLVAVFSGYFAFSGYRALGRKRPSEGAETADWAAAVAVAVACVTLGAWGGTLVLGGDTFGVVMVVFGATGTVLGVADLRAYSRNVERSWLVNHLSRMVAGYIATVTAVSVVNLEAAPAVVAWLWPTAAGVPLIWYWQAEYGDRGPLADRV